MRLQACSGSGGARTGSHKSTAPSPARWHFATNLTVAGHQKLQAGQGKRIPLSMLEGHRMQTLASAQASVAHAAPPHSPATSPAAPAATPASSSMAPV